jgi:hypothetical protein
MSAFLATEASRALEQAIDVLQRAGSPLAKTLAILADDLHAMRECDQCGDGFEGPHTANVCHHCAEDLTAESNAKHDAERDVTDYHQLPLAGGGR